MDPSDIISTPLPLHNLCTFVASSLILNLLLALICRVVAKHKTYKHSDLLDSTVVCGLGTLMTNFLFILCGIHPTKLPLHTLVSALYLAINVLLPVLLFFPTPQSTHVYHGNSLVNRIAFKLKEVSTYLFGPSLNGELPKKKQVETEQQKTTYRIQHIHQYTTLGIIIGVSAAAILRVLDHGMQIQRFPMPIIIGITWGECGGVFVGAITAMLGPQNAK